jgi:hypothetical protein
MVLLTVSGRIGIGIFILYLTSGTLLPLITPLFLLTIDPFVGYTYRNVCAQSRSLIRPLLIRRKDPMVPVLSVRKDPFNLLRLEPFTFSTEVGWYEHQVRDLVSGSNCFLKVLRVSVTSRVIHLALQSALAPKASVP